MPPKKEIQLINLEKFSVAQLPELQGKKEEIKSVIEANPIVEITNTETYESAKKSRTAVRNLRTSLEKEQKDVKRKIKDRILDVVDKEYDSLVLGVKTEENNRQHSVDVWEAEIEARRQEKIRLEQERVDGIKAFLATYVDEWKGKFAVLTFPDIEKVSADFYESYTNYDATVLQEFETLFPKRVEELTEILNSKTFLLTQTENTRLEKIRLAAEAEELARKNAELEEKQKAIQKELDKAQAEKDKFAKEKADWEKGQIISQNIEKEKLDHELKVNARINQLVEFGLKFDFQQTFVGHDFFIDILDIKTYDDEKWNKLISDIETKISTPIEEVKPLILEEEVSQELKAVQMITNSAPDGMSIDVDALAEPTWDGIFQEFKLSGEKSLSAWLKSNYNIPTKIS